MWAQGLEYIFPSHWESREIELSCRCDKLIKLKESGSANFEFQGGGT